MIKKSIALALLSAIAFPLQAIALPQIFRLPHKWTNAATGITYIYVKHTDGLQGAGLPVGEFFSNNKPILNRTNPCGYVRVVVRPNRPMTNFTLEGESYQIATAPAVPKPLVCKKVGTDFILYFPN